ncbi:probable RNA-binding protein EIF1AD [Anthonomus grandis grandis]|uniref:probable RNA-binding protein EIF1AD n=1 Tax=Anthonomus grandis grandis TaxID=2921223 RepID=UPI00216552CF|nr:probable RNA-binding protein EIF1AD [Anthonomus grandis grandis]XP_050298431.1 probable RNA-binding protein EIF1AD [Anthonomus grandis grandis]
MKTEQARRLNSGISRTLISVSQTLNLHMKLTVLYYSEMSRANKRKHVLLETFLDDFSAPTENQQIVKVLSSKGNNLHEVESTDKKTFLVSMPTKFRKNMWVKRGDFVLVEPIEEGDKVKAEIVRILTTQHIKYFIADNVWPKEFSQEKEKGLTSDNDEDIFVNPNRPQVRDDSSEEDSDSESEEEQSSESNGEAQSSDDDSNTKKLTALKV